MYAIKTFLSRKQCGGCSWDGGRVLTDREGTLRFWKEWILETSVPWETCGNLTVLCGTHCCPGVEWRQQSKQNLMLSTHSLCISLCLKCCCLEDAFRVSFFSAYFGVPQRAVSAGQLEQGNCLCGRAQLLSLSHGRAQSSCAAWGNRAPTAQLEQRWLNCIVVVNESQK